MGPEERTQFKNFIEERLDPVRGTSDGMKLQKVSDFLSGIDTSEIDKSVEDIIGSMEGGPESKQLNIEEEKKTPPGFKKREDVIPKPKAPTVPK